MNIIRPQWAAPSNVKAVSSTRHGGLSQGEFAGLNLGLHVGDQADVVQQNRQILASELGLKSDPVWLNQVHSTDVIETEGRLLSAADGSLPPVADGSLPPVADGSLAPVADGSLSPLADGSYTSKPNVVCAVMTADCLPLLLTNTHGTQVAAIHVGWRGLADGIVERAISTFDCQKRDIIAWAGPCIGSGAFEIGSEVRDQLGGSNSFYKENDQKGTYFANMAALTGERLLNCGVENYIHENACTFSDPQRFYSYRRDGQCGRMASLIWME